MKLTVGYTAPLPPGFVSGTLELKSQTVYIDKDGNQNQPYYRAAINPDKGLPSAQTGTQLQIIGMGQGDPATASPLDVVVTMVVTGLPTPLRFTWQVIPLDTGGGGLNLHAPNIHLPVIGPLPATLQNLIDQAAASQQQVYTAIQTLTAMLGQVQAQQGQVNDAIDLAAFATALIPPAVDNANRAAQAARDAAATLPCPPVADANARANYFATKTGDCSCLQMDTLHVWQRLNGAVTDLGPNSKAVGSGGVKGASTTAGLASMQGLTTGDLFTVRGAVTEGDGGGGTWMWVDSAVLPADDGIVNKRHASLTNGFFSRVRSGWRSTLAWAGLPAQAGLTAVAAAMAVLAGGLIEVDKPYVGSGTLNFPPNTTVEGKYGLGFTSDGSGPITTVLNPGTRLLGVNVDGVAPLARNDAFTTDALFLSQGTAENPASLVNCRGNNARNHVVYGYQAHGTRIENLRIDGSCAEAVFFQMADKLYINGLYGKNCQKDGLKIHSKDGQAANQANQLYDVTTDNIAFDYSNVDTNGDTLGVEYWGGQTGWVNNVKARNIHIIAPRSVVSGTFFGISRDTCRDSVISNFTVESQGRQTVYLGIEDAGCINSIYEHGVVSGYKYLGASFSQANTRNTKLFDVTFKDASTTGGTYGIQLFGGVTGVQMLYLTLKDAGDRFLFFNSAGDNSLVQGCHFLIGQQAVTPNCLYVSGTPKAVKILDNDFGPVNWAGETKSSTAYAKGGEIVGALGWTIRGNSFDALRPDGSYGPTGTALVTYGGGGGHRFESNVGLNFTQPFLGQYDNGPVSEFLNNKIVGSTVAAQQARTSGSVIDYVVIASSSGAAAIPPVTILPKQSVTNATLRTGFPDRTLSYCVLNDDNPPHGFPTTKGTLLTDRRGWELTQYNQLQYDRQTWIPYDGGDSVEYRRHSDLQGNWTAWVQFGGTAAAAVQVSFPVSGISGGVVGQVLSVSAGQGIPIHGSMRFEVDDPNLVFLAADGKYYRAGSEVGGFSGKTPGTRLFMAEMYADTDQNIADIVAGAQLPTLSPILARKELGWFKDANTLLFLPRAAERTTAPSTFVADDTSTYVSGSGSGPFVSQWADIGGISPSSSAAFANGHSLHAVSGSDVEHMIVHTGSATTDGSVLAVVYLSGSSRKQISVGGRLSGAAGSENGVTLEVDNSQGQIRLCRYVNGTKSVLNTGGANVVENTHYVLEFDFKYTYLRGRCWQAGTQRPGWQVRKFDNGYRASGFCGVGFHDGTFDLGTFAFTPNGALLSDLVNVNI